MDEPYRSWRVWRVSSDESLEVALYRPVDGGDVGWTWSVALFMESVTPRQLAVGSGDLDPGVWESLVPWEHRDALEPLLEDVGVSPGWECLDRLHLERGTSYLVSIAVPGAAGSVDEWNAFDVCIREFSSTLPRTRDFIAFLDTVADTWRETVVQEGEIYTLDAAAQAPAQAP